jgi:hypothetical protein
MRGLAFVVMSSLVSACGGGQPPEQPSPPKSEPSSSTSAAAPKAAPLPGLPYATQLKELCTIAEGVRAERFFDVAGGLAEMLIWRERVTPRLSGLTMDVVHAADGESIPAKQRYEIYKQGAAELGVPNWECRALEDIFLHVEADYRKRQP